MCPITAVKGASQLAPGAGTSPGDFLFPSTEIRGLSSLLAACVQEAIGLPHDSLEQCNVAQYSLNSCVNMISIT